MSPSWTWMSPMAATRSLSSSFTFSSYVGFGQAAEAPFLSIDLVVITGKQRTPADSPLCRGQRELGAQPLHQFLHQPSRHHIAFTRVDPAKIDQVGQQDLPVRLHVCQQSLP